MKKVKNIFLKLFSLVLITIATLLIVIVNASEEYDKTGVSNKDYDKNISIAPKTMALSFDTLLNWTPESDPDAEYSRATVPLRTGRFYGPQVNEDAVKGVKVQSCSFFKNGLEAQEQSTFHNYVFTHWQYLDSIAGWGIGNGNIGIIGIPAGDVIDAAHKNGVPITGLFGFPWASEKGTPETRKFYKQNPDGTYPYIDKLAEVCNYYGFDGFFFNQESPWDLDAPAKTRDALYYARRRYPDLIFQWYDVRGNTTTGDPNEPSARDNSNRGWLAPHSDLVKEGVRKPYAIDSVFMDYGWGENSVQNRLDYMKAFGRNPYDMHFTFETQQNGANTSSLRNMEYLVDKNKRAKASFGFYCIDSIVGMADSPEEFHKLQEEFWSTSTGDPRVEPRLPGGFRLGEDGGWAGIARYVCDKSIINRTPFTTFFNTGQGKNFYIDGKNVQTREWTNRSLQDVTPTWTWIVDSEGDEKLKASYDFDDAFYAGCSVKYEGNLEKDKAQDLKLFSTKIYQDGAIPVVLSFKEQNADDKTEIELITSRGEDYSTWEGIILKKDKDNNSGWVTYKGEIPYNENVLNGLGVRVKPLDNVEDYKLNLGRLSLLGEVENPEKVYNIEFQGFKEKSRNYGSLRLRFPKLNDVAYYEVYKVENDGTRTFLMTHANNAIYIETLFQDLNKDGKKVTIEVLPVDINGNRLEDKKASNHFYWEDSETTAKEQVKSVNVALNAEIIDKSGEGAGEPCSKMFDGTSKNNSKWCQASVYSGWVEIKLADGPKTIRRIRIEHAEYGGEAPMMNTRDFKVLYKEKLEDPNWLPTGYEYTGNELPVTDMILDKPITAEYFKLDITRADTSPWGATRIYEWQMFEEGVLPLTDTIDPSQVIIERKGADGEVADITFTNLNPLQEVFIRTKLDHEAPVIATATSSKPKDGVVPNLKLTDVNIGSETVDICYSVKNYGEQESNIVKKTVYSLTTPKSKQFSSDNIKFSPSRISTIHKRRDDNNLRFVDIEITGLNIGDKILIKQANPYNRIIKLICNEENETLIARAVCVDENNIIKIDYYEPDKNPSGYTAIEVK